MWYLRVFLPGFPFSRICLSLMTRVAGKARRAAKTGRGEQDSLHSLTAIQKLQAFVRSLSFDHEERCSCFLFLRVGLGTLVQSWLRHHFPEAAKVGRRNTDGIGWRATTLANLIYLQSWKCRLRRWNKGEGVCSWPASRRGMRNAWCGGQTTSPSTSHLGYFLNKSL
jgi:hypothetical protein